MPTIQLETIINAPRPLVFDLARDVELHGKTVDWTHEKIIGEMTTGKLEKGDIVVFEATHFGVKQRLSSQITQFEYPALFVDVMLSGAFKELKHQHQFESPSPNQTVMTDILDFTSPLGVLGHLADSLFLKRYMRTFLLKRNIKLKEFAESAAQKI